MLSANKGNLLVEVSGILEMVDYEHYPEEEDSRS